MKIFLNYVLVHVEGKKSNNTRQYQNLNKKKDTHNTVVSSCMYVYSTNNRDNSFLFNTMSGTQNTEMSSNLCDIICAKTRELTSSNFRIMSAP